MSTEIENSIVGDEPDFERENDEYDIDNSYLLAEKWRHMQIDYREWREFFYRLRAVDDSSTWTGGL